MELVYATYYIIEREVGVGNLLGTPQAMLSPLTWEVGPILMWEGGALLWEYPITSWLVCA